MAIGGIVTKIVEILTCERRWTVINAKTLIHNEYAVKALIYSFRDLVEGGKGGGCTLQFCEQLQRASIVEGSRGVKATGGVVPCENSRTSHEGFGDADTLTLAAGDTTDTLNT